MKRNEKSIEELARVMEPLPQVLYNVEVREKRDLSEFPEVHRRVQEIERSLAGPEGCWSGTPERNRFSGLWWKGRTRVNSTSSLRTSWLW